MKDLIEALQIFLKYGNPDYPTHCEHDTMYVMIDQELVSDEDKTRLDELGFSEGDNNFYSYQYGSA